MKKYKKPRDELVCIPSGFVREDGTEIMAWTLRKFVEGTPEENYDYLTNDYEQDLYSTKEQYVFMIKEDDEQDTYTMQEHVTEEKINQTEKRETDITYKIAEKNLYIIIEHQSTVDRTMPYRIQRYKMLLMNEIINKKEMKKVGYEFPRVIAIVLYTGRSKWKVEKLEDLQRPLEWYKEIDKEFELVDVNKYTEEELMKDELVITKAMLIEKQKDARKVRDILNKINQIVKNKPEKIKLLLEILKFILLNSKSE